MDRTTADWVAGIVVALVVVIGLLVTWDAFQQYQAFDEMGHMNGRMHATTNPLWYLLGTLVLAGVLSLGYVAVRDQLVEEAHAAGSSATGTRASPKGDGTRVGDDTSARSDDTRTLEQPGTGSDSFVSGRSAPGTSSDTATTGADTDEANDGADSDEVTVQSAPSHRRHLLDLLPEDERRILGPVFDSPGLTQIELRDRADFSKSKVSQTVSDLEKRGLLYREPQGRTYRIYPADDLDLNGTGSRDSTDK